MLSGQQRRKKQIAIAAGPSFKQLDRYNVVCAIQITLFLYKTVLVASFPTNFESTLCDEGCFPIIIIGLFILLLFQYFLHLQQLQKLIYCFLIWNEG